MINEKRLLDTFLEYVQIDSETKNEKAMGERLVQDLKALGFEVQTDRAGEPLAPTALMSMHFSRARSREIPRSSVPIWIRWLPETGSACDQRRHYRHRRLHHPGRR